jgi:hypothetical protein|tara:strand:- start:560 stop:697 length:138 start_codon:yes stop_codon:yes gene_type:complete
MLTELAKYSTIIIALAMVNIVWQLEKASQLLKAMTGFLEKGLDDE